MHGDEKSDPSIVAGKSENGVGRPKAERVERRGGRGEHETSQHAPDPEPGKRVPWAPARAGLFACSRGIHWLDSLTNSRSLSRRKRFCRGEKGQKVDRSGLEKCLPLFRGPAVRIPLAPPPSLSHR
jgi:hypothetical protein